MKSIRIVVCIVLIAVAAYGVFLGTRGLRSPKEKNTTDQTSSTPTPSSPTPSVSSTQSEFEILALQTRNQQRKADVGILSNAIAQYKVQYKSLTELGTIPACPAKINLGTASGNLDVYKKLVPEFLLDIPADPSSGNEQDTKYALCLDGTGSLEVHSTAAEGGEVIKATK